MSQYSPEVLAAIKSATDEAAAVKAAEQVVAEAPANEDDIVDALKSHFGGGKLRSRKFWLTVVATVLPTVIQIATGAVTWPVAVGGGVAAVVGYVLSQSGIEKQQASALGAAVSNAIIAKAQKKA
jgi:hypothetical protein